MASAAADTCVHRVLGLCVNTSFKESLDAHGWSWVQTFVLDNIVLVLCIAFHYVVVHKGTVFKSVLLASTGTADEESAPLTSPRPNDTGPSELDSLSGKTWIPWALALVRVDEEQLTDRLSLKSVLYLKTLWMLVQFSFLQALLTCAVLLP